MNRNEIFRKFLSNPIYQEKVNIDKEKIEKMRLIDIPKDLLTGVIKTAINSMEHDHSVDVSRRINQYLKNQLNGNN